MSVAIAPSEPEPRFPLDSPGVDREGANADAAAPPSPPPDRLEIVDWLRGFVIVLMTLDHTRGAFFKYGFNVADPTLTTIPLFFSRVITHMCAPTFVFLAGAGVWLSLRRGRSRGALARDLVLRGLWLLLMEFTLVHVGFEWTSSWAKCAGGIFWALGWSMILLAPLLVLPSWMLGLLGLTIIVGHNALDQWRAESWGSAKILWQFLHEHVKVAPRAGWEWSFRWPVLPWFGLIAAGYGYAPLLLNERPVRRRLWLAIGLALLTTFFVVRVFNAYGNTNPGDPAKMAGPWKTLDESWRTTLSFFHIEKYGPSFLYVALTMGVIFTLASLVDRPGGPPARWLLVFGRVPMFYYLMHFQLIQCLRAATVTLREKTLPDLLLPTGWTAMDMNHHAFLVAMAWVGTAIVVLVAYPICLWWNRFRTKHKGWWSYFL